MISKQELLDAWDRMAKMRRFPYYREAMRESILELPRILSELDIEDAILTEAKVHRARSAYFRVLMVGSSKTYMDALRAVVDQAGEKVFDRPTVHNIQGLWRKECNIAWSKFNSGHKIANSVNGTAAARITASFGLNEELVGELNRSTLTVGRVLSINPEPFVLPDDITLLR